MYRSLCWACLGLMAVSSLSAQGPALRTILKGHSGKVTSVAWSPDGQTLASGSYDETIKLWDVAAWKNTATLRAHADWDLPYVGCVAWSPDGRTLASGNYDKTVRLWDVASRNNIATLDGHTDWVDSVVWSPDGKTLATVDNDALKLWDVGTRKNTATIEADPEWINSVAWSPDGKTLVFGNTVGVIKVRNVMSGKIVAVLAGGSGSNVLAMAYSPNGKILASGNGCTIELWNATSYTRIGTLTGHSSDLVTYGHGHFGGQYIPAVTSVAFSADGKTLASGSQDKTIILWQVASGKKIATLKGHSGDVQSVQFSPDGRLLASGSEDKTIRLWNVDVRADK